MSRDTPLEYVDPPLSIGNIIHGPFSDHEFRLVVQDVMDEFGSWNFANLSFVFPNHILEAIEAVPIPLSCKGLIESVGSPY